MRLLLSILCLLTIFTSEVVLDLLPKAEMEISLSDPIEGESEVEMEEESKVQSSQLSYLSELDLESAVHIFVVNRAYNIPTRHKIQGPPPDGLHS